MWLKTYQNKKVLEAAKKEWLESLSPFKGKYIEEALQLAKKNHHFPPSLPMFVDCLKAIEAKYQPSTSVSLPTQKAPPEIVQRYMKQMKSYLTKCR